MFVLYFDHHAIYTITVPNRLCKVSAPNRTLYHQMETQNTSTL